MRGAWDIGKSWWYLISLHHEHKEARAFALHSYMLLPEGSAWGFPLCHPDLQSKAPEELWEDMVRTPEHQLQEELTEVDGFLGLEGNTTKHSPASLETSF